MFILTENKKEMIKLIARYIIICYLLYLTWIVISPEYVKSLKEASPVSTGPVGVLQVIISAVFGALTLVLKFHFETKPNNTIDKTGK